MVILHQYGTFEDIERINPDHLGPLPIITAGELRSSGANLAIGAAVDKQGRFLGEVTMVNKRVFMTPHGGVPRLMNDDERIGFSQFANMPPEGSQSIKLHARDPQDLIAQCQAQLSPEAQGAFGLRVNGKFEEIHYRGMTNQGPDTGHHASFEEMEEKGSKHQLTNCHFLLSGIYQSEALPEGMQSVSPEGWHFHGLNEDRSAGGHITDFKDFTGTVEIMPIREWHLSLNSAAQTHEKPSSKLTTKQIFHIGEVRAATPQPGRTNA
jgi:alpha-acetolactate decarboxylase